MPKCSRQGNVLNRADSDIVGSDDSSSDSDSRSSSSDSEMILDNTASHTKTDVPSDDDETETVEQSTAKNIPNSKRRRGPGKKLSAGE
jgi:hypothetical protein